MSEDFEAELRAARPHTAADGGWASSPEGDRALAAIHHAAAGPRPRRNPLTVLTREPRHPATVGLGLAATVAAAVTLALIVPSGTTVHQAVPVTGANTAIPPDPVSLPPVRSHGTGPRPADLELVSYTSCGAALAQLRAHAEQHLRAYRYGGGYDSRRLHSPTADTATVAAPATSASAPEHSVTNDQEAGVDEPDIVETDGNRVVTVSDGVLRVVDTSSHDVTGTLDLTSYAGADDAQLLMSGDRVLVILGNPTPTYYERVPIAPYYRPPVNNTTYLLVDISNAPRIVSTLQPKGSFVDARMIDGIVRLVVDSRPRLAFTVARGKHTAMQRRAADRRTIAHTALAAWQPSYAVTTNGATTTTRVPCADVSHPRHYTGASLLSVYTVDLSRGFDDLTPVSLAANAATVYASTDSLYIANREYRQTHIHRFDISAPGRPTYLGTGTVPGNLLDSYSLSEYDGSLRVVTTEHHYAQHRSTGVYVLDADTLQETGHVDGLGHGEDVQAVRFLGPLAYLVTYKQVDPFYVLDLSDPQHPTQAAEVKVSGYSDYLHPVGDGRLLGVGEDVRGSRVQGLQVSLYDVSDLARPRRIANVVRNHTPGESDLDPHAFLYWPDSGTAVVPINSWDSAQSGAVLVVHVRSDGLHPVGLIRNPRLTTVDDGYDSGIERSLYIGGSIWTMSSSGLKVSDGISLQRQAWIPFS
jgi:uncharacterized secreted protein with C-terminal beta-propeller domain